ncbi:hypothetical protein LTR36_002558 [Oleoguttula mirabilis]|uniref:Uncharacterized protein n=1 Tax=Oleoguttula mirabilis TaxID=1507867 RepID=A0AAV9JL18_9PEZI|nr:hypothetical protein LTR36_002558 [Oleoguttula mirabilis]
MPWIRDWWPSSDVILEMCALRTNRDGHEYKSFILVDSGWDAATVIAAHWFFDNDRKPHFAAARVPTILANLLLTLLDRGAVGSFAEALGEDGYEDAKVDFYRDLSPSRDASAAPVTAPYEPPSFLPKNAKLSNSKLIIVALRQLSESTVLALKAAIVGGDGADGKPQQPELEIINWQGKPIRRPELAELYRWMDHNTTRDERQEYAFFVDNVLGTANSCPQILAATRKVHGQNIVVDDQLSLLPVATNKTLKLWRAAVGYDSTVVTTEVDQETEMECGNIWRREVAVDGAKSIDFEEIECCPVFFLRPFAPQEELQIRANLSKKSAAEEGEDWGKEYLYAGYPWPDGTGQRAIQDLRDLFEKCDPRSPAFDDSYSTLRMTSYPRNFLAVDDRALVADEPRVIVASNLGFHHPTNKLGWEYGLANAENAYLNWVNLDVGNMNLDEMMNDTQRLWLSDLTAFAKEDWVER